MARLISASQIKTWMRCKELWRRKYILKESEPPRPSTQVGTAVHEALEKYLQHGEAPDVDSSIRYQDRNDRHVIRYPGRLARACLHLLPVPGSRELTVEAHSKWGGYHGYIDLEYVEDDGTPVIHDHKTTGNLKWAMTPEEMAEDVQCILYAAFGRVRHGRMPRLDWMYVQSDGKRPPQIRTYTFTEDELEKKMRALDEAKGQILDCYEKEPKRLPLSLNGCNAYGGCAFRADCSDKLTRQERFEAHMSNNDNSLGSLLQALSGEEPPLPQEPPLPTSSNTPPPAINPPETADAPEVPPEAPDFKKEAPPDDDVQKMDRPELKKLAMEMGLVTKSDRKKAPALRELIRDAREGKTNGFAVFAEGHEPEVILADSSAPPPTRAEVDEKLGPNVEDVKYDHQAGGFVPFKTRQEAHDSLGKALHAAVEAFYDSLEGK